MKEKTILYVALIITSIFGIFINFVILPSLKKQIKEDKEYIITLEDKIKVLDSRIYYISNNEKIQIK